YNLPFRASSQIPAEVRWLYARWLNHYRFKQGRISCAFQFLSSILPGAQRFRSKHHMARKGVFSDAMACLIEGTLCKVPPTPGVNQPEVPCWNRPGVSTR